MVMLMQIPVDSDCIVDGLIANAHGGLMVLYCMALLDIILRWMVVLPLHRVVT